MRRGVWPVQLRGIRRQRRDDRVIRYHRASGIRLPDDIPETHPDFIAAWARAEAGGKSPAPTLGAAMTGSLAAACIAYRASPAYAENSPAYRAMLTRHMDALRTAYGGVAVAAIRRKHITADLAKLGGSLPLARLKTWRRVMGHAVKIGMIDDDPSKLVSAPRIKSVGHPAWTHDEVDRFRKHWPIGSIPRACFELLLWTGARTVDAVAVGPQHVGRDGVLAFRQIKTKGMAYVPWTASLPAWAEGWEAERKQVHQAVAALAGGMTFLQARGSRPRSEKGLSNLIVASAKTAKIVGRTAHGLRKSRLTFIAEAGGSAHAIMAWGGHATLDEASHYTRSADARRLVTGAGRRGNAVSPADPDTKSEKS